MGEEEDGGGPPTVGQRAASLLPAHHRPSLTDGRVLMSSMSPTSGHYPHLPANRFLSKRPAIGRLLAWEVWGARWARAVFNRRLEPKVGFLPSRDDCCLRRSGAAHVNWRARGKAQRAGGPLLPPLTWGDNSHERTWHAIPRVNDGWGPPGL